MSKRLTASFLGLAVATTLAACTGSRNLRASTPPTATQPAPVSNDNRTFTDSKNGIQLSWPAGWNKQDSKDYELYLVSAANPDASLSLDIPDLPAHIPDLIPIGSVRNGYLDDLKKQHPNLKNTDLDKPTNIPSAKLRFVRSQWLDSAGAAQQTALLIVHGDHVYILRSHSLVSHEQTTKSALDQFIASLHWTNH